ncbi:clpC, partial [Symbiodinium microadriaticum]
MFVDILQVTQHAYKQIADARAGRMLTKSLNPNPEIMDSEIEKCTKQPMDSGMEDMDDELRQALLLSMQEMDPGAAAPAATAPATAPAAAPTATPAAGTQASAPVGMEGMEDMDDELRQALLLSMQESEGGAAAPGETQ